MLFLIEHYTIKIDILRYYTIKIDILRYYLLPNSTAMKL